MNKASNGFSPVKMGGVILVIALVLFGVLQLRTYLNNPNNASATQASTASTSPVSSGDVVTSISSPDKGKTKGSLPVAEAVGKPSEFKGICFLGPSGFFLYVIEDDGKNHRLVKRAFQKELIKEGFIPSPEEMKKSLQDYIELMYNNGVTKPKNIQFIVSAGAMSFPLVQNAVAAIKAKGYIVSPTSIEEEGRYALEATISKNKRDSSFIVDLTPTATRLSWYEGDKSRTVVLPGSKYNQDNMSDEQAKAEVVNKLKDLPQKNRENGIIIWAAADKLRPADESVRYAFLEDSYKTDDKLTLSGLNILYTVQSQAGTSLVFDWHSSYPIGYLRSLK